MVNFGKLPLVISALLLILLALYLGAYNGLFCFFLSYFKGDNPRYALWSPFIWVSLEYIRAHLFTGFPWVSLAYSQFKFIPIIQIVDIFGIYGLSFLIVFINISFFFLLDFFFSFQPERIKSKFLINNIVAAVLLFSMAIGYGHWKKFDLANRNEKKSLKVALIQGNIDQNLKWDTKYQDELLKIYKKLTLGAAEENIDLIVWPEAATPFYFPNDIANQRKLLQLGKESKTHILFGSPRYIKNDKDITLFNSAFLISPDEKILNRYDKIHLVPFGEYVPLQNILFFVDKMVSGIGNFDNGEEHTVLSFGESKFSVIICFEAIFPNLVRRFVKKGAGFLVNITNDAWFGKSAASYQHISMVAFRAVENRRPVIRAANTGITGIIDSRGNILAQTDIFVRDVIIGNILPEQNYQTIYTQYGDVFATSVLLVTLIFGVYSAKKKNSRPVSA